MRRLINITSVTLTLGCAVAVAASAQDSVRARVREPGRVFTFASPGGAMTGFAMHRGRLGITVDLRPDAAHDSVGARVSGVTPGGPADRAGVQTGDVITRLNGSRIAGEGRSGEGDDDQKFARFGHEKGVTRTRGRWKRLSRNHAGETANGRR